MSHAGIPLRKRVLISGATGFIGSHVVTEMVRAGHDVSTIGRRPSEIGAGLAREFVFPELGDAAAIRPAFDGVDWVVHLAGLAHILHATVADPLRQYRRANVDITRAFGEAAIASGASAFVLLSSVAALDNHDPGGNADQRRRHAYSQTKREAEGIVEAMRARSSIRAVIMRAPMVYGPMMRGNPLRLFRLVARGIPLPFARISNRRSSIYVLNLAAAIRHALEEPTATGIVHVADTEPLSTTEFVTLAAQALQVPVRLFFMPVPLLRAIGRVGDIINRITPAPVTLETIDRLTASAVLDTSGRYRLAGFTPPTTAREGLKETAEWYKLHAAG